MYAPKLTVAMMESSCCGVLNSSRKATINPVHRLTAITVSHMLRRSPRLGTIIRDDKPAAFQFDLAQCLMARHLRLLKKTYQGERNGHRRLA